MRRFFLGMAIASLTVASPIAAQAGDREIADKIVKTLQDRQGSGSLKDFDIDLEVEAGVVTLSGSVANAQQALAIVEASRATDGVVEIVNTVTVRKPAAPVTAAVATNDAKAADVQAASGQEPAAMSELATEVTASDADITDSILGSLKVSQTKEELKNFELDVSTVKGEVWVRGYVDSQAQKDLVLATIQHSSGVTKVIDDINLGKSSSVRQASSSDVVISGGQMPNTARPMAPRAFAQSHLTNYQVEAQYQGAPCNNPMMSGQMAPQMSGQMGGQMGMPMGQPGAPVAMGGGPSYGAGVPRTDNPQMPNYAWPSYAAAPNYAAVTYPKQYSASAWPYIGPFYPYPQVPLGWRKVALEWDDGLWYLDFSSKNAY